MHFSKQIFDEIQTIGLRFPNVETRKWNGHLVPGIETRALLSQGRLPELVRASKYWHVFGARQANQRAGERRSQIVIFRKSLPKANLTGLSTGLTILDWEHCSKFGTSWNHSIPSSKSRNPTGETETLPSSWIWRECLFSLARSPVFFRAIKAFSLPALLFTLAILPPFFVEQNSTFQDQLEQKCGWNNVQFPGLTDSSESSGHLFPRDLSTRRKVEFELITPSEKKLSRNRSPTTTCMRVETPSVCAHMNVPSCSKSVEGTTFQQVPLRGMFHTQRSRRTKSSENFDFTASPE